MLARTATFPYKIDAFIFGIIMNPMFTGLMIDAGRCLEKRQYYNDLIDFAAERGVTSLLWHFSDDQGCAIDFASVPGVASPHAYSRSEVRSLVTYARDRGIEIIPELASLGHTAYITRLPRFKHLAESNEMFQQHLPGVGRDQAINRVAAGRDVRHLRYADRPCRAG